MATSLLYSPQRPRLIVMREEELQLPVLRYRSSTHAKSETPPQISNAPSSQGIFPELLQTWFPKYLGYKTQATMVGMLLLALFLASMNFVMFRYLDGRPVDSSSISQTYVGAISVGLAFFYKATLVTSLWSSFTQWLWALLRHKEAKISTIDDLSKILYDSTTLLSWQAFKFQPMLYLCALLSWALAIATIFPPGTLIVNSRPYRIEQYIPVPVYDPTFRGNHTIRELQRNALFIMSDLGGYADPKPNVARMAKQTILQHHPLSALSPCGRNCSFTLTMPSPSYECEPGIQSPESMRDIRVSPYMFFGNRTSSSGFFAFQAQWYQSVTYDLDGSGIEDIAMLRNITCTLWESELTVDVKYTNGEPSFRTHSRRVQILSGRDLGDQALFSPNATRYANGTLNLSAISAGLLSGGNETHDVESIVSAMVELGWLIYTVSAQEFVWHDNRLVGPSLPNVTTALGLSNIRTIHDAVSQALSGTGSTLWRSQRDEYRQMLWLTLAESVAQAGEELVDDTAVAVLSAVRRSENLQQSLIMESSMASFGDDDFTAATLAVSEEALNSLLQNATISLLTAPNTNRTVLVTSTDNRNVYVFAQPAILVVPYAVSLLLSTAFVVIGLVSLYDNGVPASEGGFLQALKSTQGSQMLRALATDASRKDASTGDQRTLEDLKVKLGNLQIVTEERKKVTVLGFGTVSELSLATPGNESAGVVEATAPFAEAVSPDQDSVFTAEAVGPAIEDVSLSEGARSSTVS